MHRSYLPAHFRLIFLPYALERLEDGRYVVVNRRHKPLGFHSTEIVDYSPYGVSLPGLTPKKAAAISWNGSTDLDVVHLYSDALAPTASKQNWDAYQQRLAVLAALRVE